MAADAFISSLGEDTPEDASPARPATSAFVESEFTAAICCKLRLTCDPPRYSLRH
jgi:hypothetical protein